MEKNDRKVLRVVVVDDDMLVLRSVKNALADFGFDVESFEDAEKALTWIGGNGADIVITDIRMPRCDGFDVLKRVKEIDPQCDVIFITAHGQLDIAIRALREGATDFFEKPFSVSDLCAAMERTQRCRILEQQSSLLKHRLDEMAEEIMVREKHHNVMLGHSSAMRKVAEEVVAVADSSTTVLIQGESGTGKELVARAIHLTSPRKSQSFFTVNCPSIPEDLFEAEMFGHRRGAFTGAVETRGGFIEAANGGTLFLDEVGDLPLKLQAKILRLLEQRTYLPVGESGEREADVRVIAATNQALDRLVAEKKFREDLYYRLNVCAIGIPPLRDRTDDVPLLALFFMLQFASEMAKPLDSIDDEALKRLTSYDYPGNVRELRNIIESSVIRCRHGGKLMAEDLVEFGSGGRAQAVSQAWRFESLKFEDVERELYGEALKRTADNVSGAARLLGLSRGKLRRRLGALGIRASGGQEET